MKLRSRVTVACVSATLAAAAFAGSAFSAPNGLGGNACGLLTARQLATIHVTSRARCSQRTTPFKQYATVTTAKWGTVTGSWALAAVYAVKPAYVGAARQLLDKGGRSVGVGQWSSFEGLFNGKTGGSILFGVGNYVVEFEFGTTLNHPLASPKPLIALAKSIASKLA